MNIKPPRKKPYKLLKHVWTGINGAVFIALYSVGERGGGIAKQWRAPHWFAEWRFNNGKRYFKAVPIDNWSPARCGKHCLTLEEAEAHYESIITAVAVDMMKVELELDDDN